MNPSSTITALRTVRIEQRPNLIWVEIETAEGRIGLGETFRGAQAVEAYLHEQVAPWLVGRDARHIEAVSRTLLGPTLGFGASSTEVRAASAVDIALWDLAGQRFGVPVHELLGGASRETIKVYNTCAGYEYNSAGHRGGRVIGTQDAATGPYDDQVAFNRDAGALATSLLEEGIAGMKIWPFDVFAAKTGGQSIDLVDLEAGLEPFHRARQAAGKRMELMCELHSLWSVPAARRICQALEEVGVFWAEDPIAKMDDVRSLAQLRAGTRSPIAGSETLGGKLVFRELLAAEAIDIVMVDLGWCGGLTEGRKIAAIAESHGRPITAHDCTGPINLIAGLHFTIHAPTAVYQEMVRATLSSWYRELVTDLPAQVGGSFAAPTAAGLGARLNDAVWLRPDRVVRESGQPIRSRATAA